MAAASVFAPGGVGRNERAPYVVSSDLSTLWARAGFTLPRDALEQFRFGIFGALRDMFGRCEWIAEDELSGGMRGLLRKNDLPVVSLDDTYFHDQRLRLYASRLHDASGASLGRCGSWNEEVGTPEQQVKKVVQVLKACACGNRGIALVDDVIFSGKLCEGVIRLFAAEGVCVRRVYADVAVGEGIDRVQGLDLGCEVRAVRSYGKVVDQICERDFMPGAPFSGRTVVGPPNTGMPYLLPYGKPETWASIPASHARSFSATCLRLTAAIYREMEMRLNQLPRGIHGLKSGDDTGFVHELLLEAAERL